MSVERKENCLCFRQQSISHWLISLKPRIHEYVLLKSSSQQLWSTGFFCGQPYDMELVIRQSERSGHQQRLLQAFTEDVLIFSLLVYIAH